MRFFSIDVNLGVESVGLDVKSEGRAIEGDEHGYPNSRQFLPPTVEFQIADASFVYKGINLNSLFW